MKTQAIPTLEARIYIGSVEGYNGNPIYYQHIVNAIVDYQSNAPENLRGTVRVSDTQYIFKDYIEDGFQIGLLNYARFPLKEEDFQQFAMKLGEFLLEKLKQNRVSVVFGNYSYLLTSDNAETTHVKEAES